MGLIKRRRQQRKRSHVSYILFVQFYKNIVDFVVIQRVVIFLS